MSTTAAIVEDQEHALLSPSSAHTWIECAASTAAQIGQPDESSEYADEGTAAHELAKWCLNADEDAHQHIGTIIPVGGTPEAPRRTFEVDADMADAVQIYVDAIRDRIRALELGGATVTLLVEQRLPIEHITGERGARGTSDAVLIAVWANGRAELEIRDLKFGRGVKVEAERNPQAMIYADAVLEDQSDFYQFDAVNIVIHQPRVDEVPSEWRTSQDKLVAWINATARPAAKRALEIKAYRENDNEIWLPEWFNPGENQCRFCKAKAVCPALAKHVEATIGADFDTLADEELRLDGDMPTVEAVELLDGEALGRIYPSLPLIELWGKAVLGRIEHELFSGRTVPGAKLVQGRRGARQWADAEAAEKLLKGMRLKHEQMYNSTLISPTQADKLLAKDSPRRWKKVEQLITQRDGAPSVAPESDKRPALTIAPPEDDFQAITEDDGDDLI
ncbi:hypothetical protein WI29_34135 [Burkholderia ubonensis]|nr:hypothetical protein WI31_15680 [Burkholderia ubonensis]KUZ07405.1 hypothetical protein WI29_34135 [Burkholderia ubonensis]KUZ20645.1 hypothetical protein WI30_01320 [Burkholderia ubonensis]KUZ42054.1 hypothetical protein WI32_03175 [Burkholderia ubonensis]KUZ56860.1 hypothetical protein WI33_04710 [Burkholderia ubonensis]